MKSILNIKIWLIASLTLGLAPFIPEPHLWGKLKWLFGNYESMKFLDWFDLFLHGIPWLFLILSIIFYKKKIINSKRRI